MVPVKLTLKNFLCYGDAVPTLDLEGVHVACLGGQNGHGKSALLDAMTWALWGKARGRSQDELIRYGYDEMMVELDFLARDNTYRVTRRHSSSLGRRRASATDLQLQLNAADGFRPATGNSMRDTQSIIDEITGMDYDTFINSAFLMQGRADEFTNKTPGERKEVLAKVLGLDVYDGLQDRAKEWVGEKRVAAAVAEDDLERLRLEVAKKDGYASDLRTVTAEIAEVDGRRDASGQALDGFRSKVDHLRRVLVELEEITSRFPVLVEDIASLQKDIEGRRGRIVDYEELVRDRDAIEGGITLLQEVRRRYEALNAAGQTFEGLAERKAVLQRRTESVVATLEERIRQIDRRIDRELSPKADAVATLTVKLEEARKRLAELMAEGREIEEQRNRVHELSMRIGQFEASAEQLKSEGQELRSKLNLVLGSAGAARCPLCGNELGPEGCQSLSDGYRAEIDEKLRLYREREAALKEAEQEKRGLDSEQARRETELRRSQSEGEAALAVLSRELEGASSAVEEIEVAKIDLARLRRSLEEGTYAPEELEQLAQFEAQMGALAYDPGTHRGLYDEMQELQRFEQRHGRLAEASASLPQELESLVRTEEMCQRRQEELEDLETRRRRQEEEVQDIPRWEGKLREAEAHHRELDDIRGTLFRRQVELEGEVRRVELLEGRMDSVEGDMSSLRTEQAIYQDLVDAFGKRGVQAMLIEAVLPGVEEETNALLGRMTDGRMQLKLETQRERRSRRGEPIETLEINISDEMGPRSYELFSGGEAFRINLALRIALSKVLAHRRGAPLRTLFIDEGFGTQDAAGRERILDVISAIQGDFERIIVITHLEELKEAFPVRIEVQKGESGSTFWMS